ncbi:MAG: hypothetical protein WCG26_08510 [Chloroflexales bacterium]
MTDQIWLFVGEGVLAVEIVLAVVVSIVWERNPRGWFGAAKDSALRTPVKAQKVPSQIVLAATDERCAELLQQLANGEDSTQIIYAAYELGMEDFGHTLIKHVKTLRS